MTNSDDVYLDVRFPVSGLDVSDSFSGQRPGTTAVGQNVRAFEPSTQRARGGARPGLAKWIPTPLDVIQDMGLIVTTRLIGAVRKPPTGGGGTTVTVIDPGGGGGDQTGTSDGGGDDGGGAGGGGGGGLVDDPSDPPINTLGDGTIRKVRIGGSGLYTSRTNLPIVGGTSPTGKTCRMKIWQYILVQGVAAGPGAATELAIPMSPVTKGNIIIVMLATIPNDGGIGGGVVEDSQGNTYDDHSTGGDYASYFTTTVPQSGPCTITVNAATGCKVFVGEFGAGFGAPYGAKANDFIGATASFVSTMEDLANSLGYAVTLWVIDFEGVAATDSNMPIVVSSPDASETIGVVITAGVVTPDPDPVVSLDIPDAKEADDELFDLVVTFKC